MDSSAHNELINPVIWGSEPPQISIVDDDESVREAIRSLMDSVGFGTEVFSSAEDFLNSGRLHVTGCLIVDVRMPGRSGLELQRHLNAIDSCVPIVFISANDDDGARSRALSAGAVDFLKKPFSEDALLRAIGASLDIHLDVMDGFGQDESI
jgi:FixJ family two-component response regulator